MSTEADRAKYVFVYNQHVELYLPGVEKTVHARVLDMLPEDLLVRVIFDDDADADPPEAFALGFGHRSWFYRAPVRTKAFYGPCWFIDRPEPHLAEMVQRRRFVRIHFKETFYALDTNVYGEPNGEPFGLRLENISASGCYAVPARNDCAEYLMILLSLPGMSATYVVGRVIHRRPRPDGTVALGISFDGIPPGVQDDLVRVINAEIRDHLKAGQDITV